MFKYKKNATIYNAKYLILPYKLKPVFANTSSYTYNGKHHAPSITSFIDDTNLFKQTDYKLEYYKIKEKKF